MGNYGLIGAFSSTSGLATSVITTRGDIIRGNSSGNRSRYAIGAASTVLASDGTDPSWTAHSALKIPVSLEVAASDETTAITVADNKIKFRIMRAMTLNAGEAGVRASLSTAGSTSGITEIDITMNGSSIFTTDLLEIDYGDITSVGATTEPNVTTTNLTDNAEIIINVDAITGGANETGLKIQLIGVLS